MAKISWNKELLDIGGVSTDTIANKASTQCPVQDQYSMSSVFANSFLSRKSIGIMQSSISDSVFECHRKSFV